MGRLAQTLGIMNTHFSRAAMGNALLIIMAAASAQQPPNQPMTIVAPPPAPTHPIRTNPKALPDTCQRPEYPNAALRAELQGSTRVRFDVDSSGKVVGMIIAKSSGHDALDAATLAALRTCQFSAGTYNGKPTLASVFLDIAWKLDEATQSPFTLQR